MPRMPKHSRSEQRNVTLKTCAEKYAHRSSENSFRSPANTPSVHRRTLLPSNSLQRNLRKRLPPRHLSRPPRDSTSPNRSSPKRRLHSRLPRLHRQRQRPSPLRTLLLRPTAQHQSHSPLAGSHLLQPLQRPRRSTRLRSPKRHPRHEHQEATLEYGRESRAL